MRGRKLLVEELLLNHLGGAYNPARWIVESDADTQAVVQEGYTYALKQLEKFRAVHVRIRLLTIVCHYFPAAALHLVVGNTDEVLDHLREQRVGLGLSRAIG